MEEHEVEFEDDQLILECDSGGHYMTVTYITVDDEYVDAWLAIKAMPRTYWQRIKLAWEALFSRKPFEVNEMSLAAFDKAEKLKEMAQKIQDVLRAFDEKRRNNCQK